MQQHYEVIIIGGSYAGLSAALALGRSLREVLIIDSNQPCNRQTPRSHNFLTQDGVAPNEIAAIAKKQVLAYDTVNFLSDLAITVNNKAEQYNIGTLNHGDFYAKKLLFATGVKDLLPSIEGFSSCWGISVLHCPYCHGYEVHHQKLGIIANGEAAFELCNLIQHWTDDLVLLTNGTSTLSADDTKIVENLNISIIQTEIQSLQHDNGQLKHVLFRDGDQIEFQAIFSRVPNEQHCKLPLELGCEVNEQGLLVVDPMQKTNVNGIYAAGDNVSIFRGVSMVNAAGTKAGVAINMELIQEQLQST